MMAIVERRILPQYPSFPWAKSIQVKTLSNDSLEISGIVPYTNEERHEAPDLFREYRKAIQRYGGEKRQGKNSPHVQFANATTRQKQIEFVKRYGPVIVKSCVVIDRPAQSTDFPDLPLTETVITAEQSLEELNREHMIFRSAVDLVFELQHGKDTDLSSIRKYVRMVLNNTSGWPAQWERERRLRAGGLGWGGQPRWKFTTEDLEYLQFLSDRVNREPSADHPLRDALVGWNPVYDGHETICKLLNSFAPLVYLWDAPVEAPHPDVSTGIRPVLYYVLRREYLAERGIGICRNVDCRDVFEIERSGQEFCNDDCSRLQRQREYWATRGKKLRAIRDKNRSKKSKKRHSRQGGKVNR